MILSKFLQASFFLNSNNEQSKILVSPITDKSMNEDDFWPIEKLVKEFINLKENILAYQKIKNFNNRALNNFDSNDKNMTFKPKITKYSRFSQNYFTFEERAAKFLEAKKEKLERIQKETQESQMKENTFKPVVNNNSKYNSNSNNWYNSKGREYEREFGSNNTSNILNNKDNNNNNSSKAYERLYNIHNRKRDEQEKQQISKQEKDFEDELKECTFKPMLNNRFDGSEKFRNQMPESEKKIYDSTIERMRNGILENFTKKYLAEK